MTMLRSIVVALGAAACLLAFAALGELPGGPIARALAGVVMGVGVTALVYGEATFVAVTLGAMSPLVFAAAERASLATAASAMCLFWLTPRFVLPPTPRRLIVLVAVSTTAAAIAGSVFAAYLEAPWAAHAASSVFAGSCLSLVGVLVPVPSTTAFALRTAAGTIDGPIRAVVLRSADEYESSRWQPRARSVRRTWRKLVRLVDQRASLEQTRGHQADQRRQEIERLIQEITHELAPDGSDATSPAPSGAAMASDDHATASPLDVGPSTPTVTDAEGAQPGAIELEDAQGEPVMVLDETQQLPRNDG